MLQPAKAMDCVTRGRQMRGVRVVAGKLQREIRLASRIELGRSAGIEVPAPVFELLAANIVGQLGDTRWIGLTENKKIIDVVRFQGRVCFEFALPVTAGLLQGEQMLRAALYGFRKTLRPVLLPRRYGRYSSRMLFTHSDE